MRKFRKISMFALMVSVLAITYVCSQRMEGKGSVDAEFQALIDHYYAVWNTGNLDNAGKFYVQDADAVFYDLKPLEYHGWQEYKRGIQENFVSQVNSGSVTPRKSVKVTRRGNVAWTTMTARFIFHLKDGRTEDLEARHTAIWERRKGHWLIVHEHLSVPMKPF